MSTWEKFTKELNEKLDYEKIYSDLGCEPRGRPNKDGWVSCLSHEFFGGEDTTPSASFNVRSGWYKDYRRGGKAVSLYDLLVEIGECQNWREAQTQVARKAGVKLPSISKSSPVHGVLWQEWKDENAEIYCSQKPPITIEGLKLSGALLCSRYKIPCFAWPIYDENLRVLGYYYVRRDGKPFPNGGKSIVKKFDGAEAGLIGTPAVTILAHNLGKKREDTEENKDDDFYWTEGVPDLVAGYSTWPDGKFICNPSGCGETVSQIQFNLLNNGNVRLHLVADADVPGVSGVLKRKIQLDRMPNTRCVLPWCAPYDVEDKNGKDLRDFLTEKKDAGLLQDTRPGDLSKWLKEVLEEEAQQKIKEREAELEDRYIDNRVEWAENLLEDLGIHVLSSGPGSSVTLYSDRTNKKGEIKNLSNFKYPDGMSIFGGKFSYRVTRNEKDASGDKVSFNRFLDAVGLVSSTINIKKSELSGPGIWPLKNGDLSKSENKLLITYGECFTTDGETLTKYTKPTFHGISADLTQEIEWFDNEKLEMYLQKAQDPKWRLEVHQELHMYLSTWKWAYQGTKNSPGMDELVCGLIYATWLQTLWRWRPIIGFTGESGSGKSMFFETLDDLFMGLANSSAQSTTAGIMQSLQRGNAQPLLCDEFDSSIEQGKLLKTFRTTSRGQKTLKGTRDQDGKTYHINHIPWISGIYATSKEQADLNRIINLSILKHDSTEINQPSETEARELGHKILSCVLSVAETAVFIAEEISKSESSKLDLRYRESYSVPFSCIGAVLDLDVSDTREFMDGYLDRYVEAQVESENALSDHESVLNEILLSTVFLGPEAPQREATVATILFDPEFKLYLPELDSRGIRIVTKRDKTKRVVFSTNQMTGPDGILKKSDKWKGNSGLKTVLSRLNGKLDLESESQRVGGRLQRCLSIGYDRLREWASQ